MNTRIKQTVVQVVQDALKRNHYLENRGSIMYAAFKKGVQ